jgi:hypothetical protein
MRTISPQPKGANNREKTLIGVQDPPVQAVWIYEWEHPPSRYAMEDEWEPEKVPDPLTSEVFYESAKY